MHPSRCSQRLTPMMGVSHALPKESRTSCAQSLSTIEQSQSARLRFSLPQSTARQLTLVHVLEGAATSDAHRENALSRLQRMAADNGTSATYCVETGAPDNVVGSIARATAADLVVIGRSSPGPLGRLRAQSYGIIRESPCPVLSV